MKEKNEFGGRKGSSYTPMSEDEQEVISRLVESKDLKIIIKGWGEVSNPVVRFGDLRVSLAFRVNFSGSQIPVPVYFFDMELRTGSGMLVFKERQPTVYDGKPVNIAGGMYLDMVWDIAISSMDPKFVKSIKPGAVGLTSRWLDRDTGARTLVGNNVITPTLRNKLRNIREGERASRIEKENRLIESYKKLGGEG
jgi:hypothetical protein